MNETLEPEPSIIVAPRARNNDSIFVTIQRNRWKRKKAQAVTVQSALNSFILAFEAY
jgi:hypothetical protein